MSATDNRSAALDERARAERDGDWKRVAEIDYQNRLRGLDQQQRAERAARASAAPAAAPEAPTPAVPPEVATAIRAHVAELEKTNPMAAAQCALRNTRALLTGGDDAEPSEP